MLSRILFSISVAGIVKRVRTLKWNHHHHHHHHPFSIQMNLIDGHRIYQVICNKYLQIYMYCIQ